MFVDRPGRDSWAEPRYHWKENKNNNCEGRRYDEVALLQNLGVDGRQGAVASEDRFSRRDHAALKRRTL